ncbi:MAG: hypothetical protein WBC44_02635, partial [Planctomycetaceae bacterium]
YTRVSQDTSYTAGTGYGWLDKVSDHDRGTGEALTSDFNYGRQGTFVVDLADGLYDVTLTLGDSAALRDQVAVSLEGQQVDLVTTDKGQFHTTTYRVEVTDGQLTLLLQDLGGASQSFAINALEIQAVDQTLDDVFANDADGLLMTV